MEERGIASGRELARLTEIPAKRMAVKPVTSASASSLIKGAHGHPSERTLALLAEALVLPLWRLRRAAGAPAGEPEPYRPPAEASRLSRRERRAVDEVIRLLAGSGPLPEAEERLAEGRPSVRYLGVLDEVVEESVREDDLRQATREERDPAG